MQVVETEADDESLFTVQRRKNNGGVTIEAGQKKKV